MNKTENERPGGWHFTSGGEVHLFHWVDGVMVSVCGASHDKYIPSYANDRISCRKCRRITVKDHPEMAVYLDNPTGVEPVDVVDAEKALSTASTNAQLAEWARTYGKQIVAQLKLHS